MRTDLLTEPVDGLTELLAVVDAFDRTLVNGLLRPQPAQAAALADLADALAAGPLAAGVAGAAEKAATGAAGEEHLMLLAAARGALLGAAHDALAAVVTAATGRTAGTHPAAAPAPAAPLNVLAAARSWLCDLARAGWQGIDHELVAGAAPVVSAMLPDPALRRLAVLLDGFAAELAASCPGAALERVPVRRWADLWARALLLTQPGALAEPPAVPVTGRLLPLGVDLQEHATAAQAQVHAVFEPADGGPSRLVRASVAVPKPDTVVGAGVWQLLRPQCALLAAAGEGRAMELTGMALTAAGDLHWQDELAVAGEPADPFATARVALAAAHAAVTPPLERHPARLAEPVFLVGYAVRPEDAVGPGAGADQEVGMHPENGVRFELAGHQLFVDTDRIPAAGPLTPAAVAASTACIGLLRWDAGRFVLQPLAVETTVKKKTVAVHAGGWAGGTADKLGVKAEKAATEAVAVLRERAGRLLRK
ncbi:hypothetical protein C7C46_13750 [Streptomyces tateyamensis]|uniref:Uncharacterized protein n=2 Tax=Streptomyces tateyamensis TaxID=565073 RepID=A0A2V4N941_9ACTN|nr:hypothetical protein C7C46_13750 [Streptomyces tateyamensis]